MNSLARNFRFLRGLWCKIPQKIPQIRGNCGKLARVAASQYLYDVSHIRSLSTKPPPRWQHSERREVDSDSNSDSDSDSEHQSNRGESDFWRRKMRTLHNILDVNKDGVLSFDDFILLSDRFNEQAHLSDKHHKEFKTLMQEVWEAQYGAVDRYNLVTTEQFLEEMHHALNDKPLRKKLHNFLPYLFKAVDKDRSGEITVEEFKLFFTCLGLDNEDAVLSFHAIDENDDGRVTIKEFVHLGKEYFLSEDEGRTSKWFWGPLIQH